MESVGAATGCGFKEIYRFPHTTYPYSSCICSFLYYIIESVDSISRDERDSPLTHYIKNAGISHNRYTIMHFKYHHRALQLISNRMSVYNISIIVQFTYTARSNKSLFSILLSSNSSNSSSFFSRPSVIVLYLLTLIYM